MYGGYNSYRKYTTLDRFPSNKISKLKNLDIMQQAFSFLLNNVYVAANKPNTKGNKTGFILFSPNFPPINCRLKKELFFLC